MLKLYDLLENLLLDIENDIKNNINVSILSKKYGFKVRYELSTNKVCFEKIDTKLSDENYCQMEWFAPVSEKNK